MKVNLFVLLGFMYFVVACKKEDNVSIFFPGEMTYGKMEAKKNGKEWIASSAAHNYDTIPSLFGLGASTFSEDGFLREDLIFNKIPKEKGKYIFLLLEFRSFASIFVK